MRFRCVLRECGDYLFSAFVFRRSGGLGFLVLISCVFSLEKLLELEAFSARRPPCQKRVELEAFSAQKKYFRTSFWTFF